VIASIVDWATLGKAAFYSLLFGIGASAIFGLGVSSVAGLLDAVRERRATAMAIWGTLAFGCIAITVAVVVLGVVVMSEKG
jgi:hypothetical protein